MGVVRSPIRGRRSDRKGSDFLERKLWEEVEVVTMIPVGIPGQVAHLERFQVGVEGKRDMAR